MKPKGKKEYNEKMKRRRTFLEKKEGNKKRRRRGHSKIGMVNW